MAPSVVRTPASSALMTDPNRLKDVPSPSETDEIDWGEGAEEVIEAACDLENPESCESCQ